MGGVGELHLIWIIGYSCNYHCRAVNGLAYQKVEFSKLVSVSKEKNYKMVALSHSSSDVKPSAKLGHKILVDTNSVSHNSVHSMHHTSNTK